MKPTAAPVTLDTCDREPIHIPGAIQSHGALIGFEADGSDAWCSGNAASLLQVPALMPGAAAVQLGDALQAIVATELSALAAGESPRQSEIVLACGAFDLISHMSGQCAVLE